MDTLSLSKMSAKKNKDKKDDDNDDNNDAFSYKTGGSGIHRNLNKPKRKEISFGEEYRAKVILFFLFHLFLLTFLIYRKQEVISNDQADQIHTPMFH
jgi:hypothetical protein